MSSRPGAPNPTFVGSDFDIEQVALQGVGSTVQALVDQERVGDSITILCSVPVSFLDEVGVRDSQGAPWYDRALFGTAKQSIAMPTALIIDGSGRVLYAYRATRVDDRAAPHQILTAVSRATGRVPARENG